MNASLFARNIALRAIFQVASSKIISMTDRRPWLPYKRPWAVRIQPIRLGASRSADCGWHPGFTFRFGRLDSSDPASDRQIQGNASLSPPPDRRRADDGLDGPALPVLPSRADAPGA